MASHSSSDDAARYRDADVYEEWKKKDPIGRFQQYLKHRKLWTEEFEAECSEQQKAELQAAIGRVESGPDPIAATMFDDVYMNLTPQLRAQRDELKAMMAKGGGDTEVGHFPL
jgi:TPP-dependent pyruvate/acetoin dehydrogenase alpha subunit